MLPNCFRCLMPNVLDKLRAICGTFAAVEMPGGRAYFNRRERNGKCLLWALGRGR